MMSQEQLESLENGRVTSQVLSQIKIAKYLIFFFNGISLISCVLAIELLEFVRFDITEYSTPEDAPPELLDPGEGTLYVYGKADSFVRATVVEIL